MLPLFVQVRLWLLGLFTKHSPSQLHEYTCTLNSKRFRLFAASISVTYSRYLDMHVPIMPSLFNCYSPTYANLSRYIGVIFHSIMYCPPCWTESYESITNNEFEFDKNHKFETGIFMLGIVILFYHSKFKFPPTNKPVK